MRQAAQHLKWPALLFWVCGVWTPHTQKNQSPIGAMAIFRYFDRHDRRHRVTFHIDWHRQDHCPDAPAVRHPTGEAMNPALSATHLPSNMISRRRFLQAGGIGALTMGMPG